MCNVKTQRPVIKNGLADFNCASQFGRSTSRIRIQLNYSRSDDVFVNRLPAMLLQLTQRSWIEDGTAVIKLEGQLASIEVAVSGDMRLDNGVLERVERNGH